MKRNYLACFALLLLCTLSIGSLLAEDEALHDFRIWTSAKGKFSVEAKYAGYHHSKVLLEKRDKKFAEIEIEKLSNIDRQWIEDKTKDLAERASAAERLESPFTPVESKPTKSRKKTQSIESAAPKLSFSPSYSSGSDVVHVKGYHRKDGTYVQPHTRSKPKR